MKPCPFCGEQIQPAAVKCRFCGEWLDPSKRPAWSTPDIGAITEKITREVTRQLAGAPPAPEAQAAPASSPPTRPPRRRSSTRDIPSDPHQAGLVEPDASGTAAGSVEFNARQPESEPQHIPDYEDPGPYPGLPHQEQDASTRSLGQPAPAARWTPGGIQEEAAPSWQAPETPAQSGTNQIWKPPQWVKPESAPAAQPQQPSWGAPSSQQQPGWGAPAPQTAESAQAPSWSEPQQSQAPSWSAPAEASFDEDDDEFDDGEEDEDDFAPLAAQSGRHRRRKAWTRDAVDSAPAPVAALARELPPEPRFDDDDDFDDDDFDDDDDDDDDFGDAPAKATATKAKAKAKPPRDLDDDDFDDDDDDDDFDDDDDDDFDDDDDDDFSSMSAGDLGESMAGGSAGPRKLPWVPISVVSGLLVVVLGVVFRGALFGGDDDGGEEIAAGEEAGAEEAAAAEAGDTPPEAADADAAGAESEGAAEAGAAPEEPPPPPPPAIAPEELDAKIAEATTLVNKQKYDDAQVIIDEILGKLPKEGRTLGLLAQAQLERGKLEDALATANDCVGADPSQSFCWITVATVEQANANDARALEAYRKYLEVEPDGRHAKSAKRQVSSLAKKVEG